LKTQFAFPRERLSGFQDSVELKLRHKLTDKQRERIKSHLPKRKQSRQEGRLPIDD
jgi:hypothetical protein